MNEANYASLEASKRLVDNGIVLETEVAWFPMPNGWELLPPDVFKHTSCSVPAPSMAEVWRELPETIDEYDLTCEKIFNGGIQAGYTTCDVSGLRWRVLLNAANPTDALIDLLIWVKEASHEGR